MSPSIVPTASILLSTALLLLLLLGSPADAALNITLILSRFPDYSTFNSLLTKTGLDKQINSRQTITILGIANAQISSISGQPENTLKTILGNHIVLDYYDTKKLNSIPKGSTTLTTLYQTTGAASHQQGFLNVANKNGEIVFGSAEKGAVNNVKLVQSLLSQPYNISVLQVSGPIIAPGLGVDAPAGPASAPVQATPVPGKKGSAPPDPDSDEADSPVAESPEDSDYSPTESPDAAPESSPTPSPSPSEAPAETPAADDDGSDASPPSAAGKAMISSSSFGLLVGLVASYLVAM